MVSRPEPRYSPQRSRYLRYAGFTLVELLIVIAVIAILAGLLLPTLARSKARAHAIFCQNNLRQLTLGWMMYATDNSERLVYNLGGYRGVRLPQAQLDHNWVNNIMGWEREAEITNLAFIAKSPLGAQVGMNTRIFQCPSDKVLSAVQKRAGWSRRARSYALNAMVGDAGENVESGGNRLNPGYRQFLKLSDIARPVSTFAFLDEHPDSITDGYFLMVGSQLEWGHLPGSHHGGAANISHADGHLELHQWVSPSTKRPMIPDSGIFPVPIPVAERKDFDWLNYRTSYGN